MNDNLKVYLRLKTKTFHTKNTFVLDKEYKFDKVFHEDNALVYKMVAQPHVNSFLLGFNVTLLAYGQTNSGKTHTIQGKEEDFGLLQRIIFDILDKKTESDSVSFSYVEIYNEKVTDLFRNVAFPSLLVDSPQKVNNLQNNLENSENNLQNSENNQENRHEFNENINETIQKNNQENRHEFNENFNERQERKGNFMKTFLNGEFFYKRQCKKGNENHLEYEKLKELETYKDEEENLQIKREGPFKLNLQKRIRDSEKRNDEEFMNYNLRESSIIYQKDHLGPVKIEKTELSLDKKQVFDINMSKSPIIYQKDHLGPVKIEKTEPSLDKKQVSDEKKYSEEDETCDYLTSIFNSKSIYEISSELPEKNLLKNNGNSTGKRVTHKKGKPSDTVQIREDLKRGIYLENATILHTQDFTEIMAAFKEASKNRKTSQATKNEYSSRSHAIFTIYLNSSGVMQRNSKYSIIDLAGSEKISLSHQENDNGIFYEGKSQTEIPQLKACFFKETCKINKSLLTLGSVIEKLSRNQEFINYRDSKLTFLLKDCLSGNSQILIIGTIDYKHEEENCEGLNNSLVYVKDQILAPILQKAVHFNPVSKSNDMKKLTIKETNFKSNQIKNSERNLPENYYETLNTLGFLIKAAKINIDPQVNAQIEGNNEDLKEELKKIYTKYNRIKLEKISEIPTQNQINTKQIKKHLSNLTKIIENIHYYFIKIKEIMAQNMAENECKALEKLEKLGKIYDDVIKKRNDYISFVMNKNEYESGI